MERLTTKTKFGWQLNGSLYVRGDVKAFNAAIDKLAQFEDAEADGRLVVLPYKLETPVWVLEKKLGSPRHDFVRERIVNSFGFATDGYSNMQLIAPEGAYPYLVHDIFLEFDEIGKTIFLTREEAEQALAEKGGSK